MSTTCMFCGSLMLTNPDGSIRKSAHGGTMFECGTDIRRAEGYSRSGECYRRREVRDGGNGWTHVTEGLPAVAEDVILCSTAGVRFVGWLNSDFTWGSASGHTYTNTITHWAPLLDRP